MQYADSSANFDYETLEFPLFCSLVAKSFTSSFAQDRLINIRPKSTVSDTLLLQNEIKTILDFYSGNKYPVLLNDHAFYTFYNGISSDNVRFKTLEADEYLCIKSFLYAAEDIRQYIAQRKSLSDRLASYLAYYRPNMELASRIDKTFEENGDIKDGASARLSQIRHKIKDMRKRIQQTLSDTFNKSNADKYIQEQVVVLRSGRYTVPCKTNFSQYISGVVHDRSASGQTLYVEPSSCIPLNNDLQESILAEIDEITVILNDLFNTFMEGLPQLKITVNAYSELMFRIEIALFYHKFDVTFPEFGSKIKFINVHHPLLKLNKGDLSVPISLSLEDKQNLLVVSGPNTGGKTASLKSVGLNHIIAMCGLPIFGQRADMVFFKEIRADIGDKQSLVMDLSTFSSHMTKINSVIRTSGGGSLVLFDELGTGTDPKEGAALALSILDFLLDKRSKVMVTTHFSEVKSYAFDRDDAVIYSVDFDYETFTPQYGLLEGVAGRSDPILIARRLGFPDTVINAADKRMKAMKSQSEMLLEEINLMKAEVERGKKDLAEREQLFGEKLTHLEQQRNALDEKLSKRELELLEDTYAFLQRGKRLADERIKASHEDIKKDLDVVGEKIKKIKSLQKPIESVKVGDVIFLDKYSKSGKILTLDSKYANIDLEGIKVKILRSELVGKKVEKEKAQIVNVQKPSSGVKHVRNEILLVGKRVEEAVDLIDVYIDESQLNGYDKVYLIHGRGSGQLRRGLHEFLRTCGRIKSYQLAGHEEGGDAVTVVLL